MWYVSYYVKYIFIAVYEHDWFKMFIWTCFTTMAFDDDVFHQ